MHGDIPLPLLILFGIILAAIVIWSEGSRWRRSREYRDRHRRDGIQPEMRPGPKDWVVGNKAEGTGTPLERCPTDGNHLLCPDCGQPSLLAGPSGGMSQNIACESCHSEFNMGMFDQPPLIMERMGKLTIARAQIYGISPTEFAARQAKPS